MRLEIHHLSAFYGRAQILSDVSLKVPAGEVVVLIGRNGAGKSTTLKSIIGLVGSRSGRILFNGTDITRLPTDAIARIGVGYVPEDRRIFRTLTVAENLLVGASRHGRTGRSRDGGGSRDSLIGRDGGSVSTRSHDRETATANEPDTFPDNAKPDTSSWPGSSRPSSSAQARPGGADDPARRLPAGHWTHERLFALFPNLADLMPRPAGQISGGEQQMLAIARTLMGQPSLIMLDEPSEGLAPLIVERMASAVAEMKAAGLSVLLAEQNLAFAEATADRAYILEKGHIRREGPVRELLADEDVRRTYLAA
jgi:ABC-type branched-subunit amino acid transport system ATPase component